MRFEDLEVWKRSARISVEIYKASREIRDFSFRDQLTRSGLSIPRNLAEGWERQTQKEFIRFIRYALGSCGELRTQLYIGMEAGYINHSKAKAWVAETRELTAKLRWLQESVNQGRVSVATNN